ncbi:MAG: hypothetical protein LC790_13525 [Actinobacteria bacterium]|nr:hypothetical protein [Actinomycetota bacterium]
MLIARIDRSRRKTQEFSHDCARGYTTRAALTGTAPKLIGARREQAAHDNPSQPEYGFDHRPEGR